MQDGALGGLQVVAGKGLPGAAARGTRCLVYILNVRGNNIGRHLVCSPCLKVLKGLKQWKRGKVRTFRKIEVDWEVLSWY